MLPLADVDPSTEVLYPASEIGSRERINSSVMTSEGIVRESECDAGSMQCSSDSQWQDESDTQTTGGSRSGKGERGCYGSDS